MKTSRLTITLLTALFALTACGGGGNKPEPEPQPEPEPGPSEQVTVTLDQTEASVAEGETLTLVASSSDAEATFTWSSSNEEVATVVDGVVTAVKTGTATITATRVGGTEKAECVVTVVGDYFIQEDTEILVQTTFNDTYGEIFKTAIANLKKKEPKLTVKYDKYSGSYTDLKNAVIQGVPADNYADVVAAYPDSVADFINAGVHMKMDKYMSNSEYGWTAEERADFYDMYIEEGQSYSIPGTYSLPIAKSTEAMYYDYNKIIGLDLSKVDPTINNGEPISEAYVNSLTWDELFNKFAPALLAYRETIVSSSGDPEKTAALRKAFLDTETYSDWAVVGYDSDDNLFITLAEQYGYGYTSVNQNTGAGKVEFVNDGMKNLIKQFNVAYKNKYITTKGIIGTNVNYRSNDDAMLFSIGSTGGVNYQFKSENPKKVGVARIPQAAGKEVKLIQQGPSLAFLNHPKAANKDVRGLASWLFYKELTSVKNQIAWSTVTGYSPIRLSVSESDEYLYYSDPNEYSEKTLDRLKAVNAQYVSDTSEFLFTSPVFKGSSEARTQVAGIVTEGVGAAELTDEKLNSLFETAANNASLKMK